MAENQPQHPPKPQGRPQAPAKPVHSPDLPKDFRHIVRICNTDLDGNKSLIQGMNRIKGVSFMFANMACRLTGVNGTQKAGVVPEIEIKKIDDFLRNPGGAGAPDWMMNRRKDPESGNDMHVITTDLMLARDNDIKMMKKIRSYKGVRHAVGLPVRGQRTRSNFRPSKRTGTGGRLGVVKKKDASAAAPAKKDK